MPTYVRNTASSPRKRGKGWLWLSIVAIITLMIVTRFSTGHASTTSNTIRSGVSGMCLDVLHSGKASGTPIDAARCNGSPAQDWTVSPTTIQQQHSDSCVTAAANELVALRPCSGSSDQVWLRDQHGYFNPETGKCLQASNIGAQLHLASCNDLTSPEESWSPGASAQKGNCRGGEGAAVACSAVQQWTAWQDPASSHEALLSIYTDGTPYEAWCADFVSYIYKQAGHPFTKGGADGWDENEAGNIQYMGFTIHPIGDGYVPKAGDVAYFSYPGGHVEIVVSGGPKPTFVYGDSAEVDPSTGNGQMKANTVTEDSNGQLQYYLSPLTNS